MPMNAAPNRSLSDLILSRFQEEEPRLPTIAHIADALTALLAASPTPDTLAALLHTCPVTTAQMIHQANSDFYRDLQQVDNVPDAISRLGFDNACMLAKELADANVFQTEDDEQRERMERLFQCAMGNAIAAREIARLIRYPHIQRAFLAGLVQNVGKICIVQSLSELIESDVAIPRITDVLLSEIFHSLNAEIGSHLLTAWHFPEDVIESVRLLGKPDAAPPRFKLVWIVLAAEGLLRKMQIFPSSTPPPHLLSNTPPMQALRLSDLQIADLMVTLEDLSDEMRIP